MIAFLAKIPHPIAVAAAGLATTGAIILGAALVQLSTNPATDLHLWVHSLIFGELGAFGSYIVTHLKPAS